MPRPKRIKVQGYEGPGRRRGKERRKFSANRHWTEEGVSPPRILVDKPNPYFKEGIQEIGERRSGKDRRKTK